VRAPYVAEAKCSIKRASPSIPMAMPCRCRRQAIFETTCRDQEGSYRRLIGPDHAPPGDLTERAV
jgi:hypothetical protein